MNKYKDLFITTTDTITGIGAPVSKANKEAIYELKGRDKRKPLIIMVDTIEKARKLEGWSKNAEELAQKHWPGDTTLVLTDEISVRIPNNKDLLALLAEKGPCYVTSANISGEAVYPLDKAKETFKEINECYDFGKSSQKPSKIIDVRTGKVLR